jgi:acyl-CoA synthetase (NDP forming)
VNEEAPAQRARHGLQAMLEPRSVAVIGASDDPARIGGRPLRYMMDSGFEGELYPVNPKRETVQGLRAYPAIDEIGKPLDCAIIAVPAKIVANTLRECADAGVRSAIVFSSGFSEVGGEGTSMQQELSDIARQTGLRILGPNCLGLLSFRNRFFATFSSTGDLGYPEAGDLAIISQSGAYGTHLYAVAAGRGLGVSHVITTGNECDVSVAECISWAAEKDEVKVIAAYAEGTSDGPALVRSLELARERGKPVIFMKVGRSAEGAAAAASHTASLAGSDKIYDAVFAQYGVFRADTTEEMLDAAYGCTAGIYPQGKKIGLVTISGGVGVQMADYANKMGLDVAPMPKAAQKRLKEKLPFASALNPVDTTAQFFNDMSLVSENFSIMLEEGKYDIAVAFFTMAAASRFVIDPLLEVLDGIRKRFPDRLIILSLIGSDEVVARYREAGFLTFEDPCRAISTAAALVVFGESFGQVRERQPETRQTAHSAPIPARAMSEWDSREILSASGVPMGRAILARTAEEAAAAAKELGGLIAMKINGADICHKTEIGGVELNVASPEDAARVHGTLMARMKELAPQSHPDGVIVAAMATGGVEVILGVQVDPVFGPAVMFGLGGIFAELFEDVAFRMAPFDRDAALAMVGNIKGAKLLEGVRGKPALDVHAIADALVSLSEFAAAHADELASVDLNPCLVMENGIVALDALVVPKAVEKT